MVLFLDSTLYECIVEVVSVKTYITIKLKVTLEKVI